ncbi:MAG TPA: hypothetical protein VJ873_10450 [bacterium]|nr:hypothetical protein [bacterium]
MPESAVRYPKNLDVKCLRCGAMNIPENHICGHCGANLPLVYDEEGKVFDWERDSYLKNTLKRKAPNPSQRPNQVRWLMRFGILLAAFLCAWFIMRHR